MGINVGKFTEEPKIVNSIAKFFQKSVSKEVVPTTTAESDHEKTHAAAVSEKSETGQSSKISSYFVNHSKNITLAKSPAKNDAPIKNDDNKQQDSPKKQFFEEHNTNFALVDEAVGTSDEETSRDFADTYYEPSQDINTEAPCPQCGSLVSIVGMSEHLDHHVATELHKELNQAVPTVASNQSASSSMGGVAVKRKYTKKTESQSGAKKTRSIQSFFSQK